MRARSFSLFVAFVLALVPSERVQSERSHVMDWGGILKGLTGAEEGNGKCMYAAVHNLHTGACLAYMPLDIFPVSSSLEYYMDIWVESGTNERPEHNGKLASENRLIPMLCW